ncbi:HAD hydrolase family protein [Rhodococcoides yunnanense]|uniref:HAD hydrolase family protein n=1 Tax=Rhodococcoides yunnanense TaxID=278209 RepID=UPI000AE8FD61|nr:HAD hydrolase family protein [Rhodococcus yunnanensis]
MVFEAGRPTLVALDVDGTLHASEDSNPLAHETISVAVRASVRNVVRSGAHVVLCTGRLAPATRPFLCELGIFTGFAICSNGAVMVDIETGEVVEQVSFDLSRPIAVLREQLPGAIFVAENPGIGVRATGRVADADTHHGKVELVDIDDLSTISTTRLAVHWPGHSGRELAERLTAIDLPDVRSLCYGDEPVADLTAVGVHKAAMLEKLRVDLEDRICPSGVEDGLATALSEWFG